MSSHNEYRVQSITFDKSMFTPEQVYDWIRSHGYKFSAIDETENQLRVRQFNPEYVRRLKFTHYVTKDIGNGIALILVYRI
jgi:hypothetical protein